MQRIKEFGKTFGNLFKMKDGSSATQYLKYINPYYPQKLLVERGKNEYIIFYWFTLYFVVYKVYTGLKKKPEPKKEEKVEKEIHHAHH
jgi:hypothetical protein